MNQKIIEIARHIFDARIDNARNSTEYNDWCSARDVFEYTLAENVDCLKEFDYMKTNEEKGN